MKTYKRICIKDFSITEDGKTFSLKRGEEYITSTDTDAHGETFVFGEYWARVPVSIFAGEIPGPGDSH